MRADLRVSSAAPTAAASLAAGATGDRPGFGRVARGYNHQVPYCGRVFHVQTEDSGRAKGHVDTHVFYAGTIVASSRIDYDGSIRATEIDALLKDAHKSMLRRLVRGGLDEAISRRVGGSSGAADTLALPAGQKRSSQAGMASKEAPVSQEAPVLPGVAGGARTLRRSEQDTTVTQRANEIIESLGASMAGVLGIAVVDCESGRCLASAGTGIDIIGAAAGSTGVMKAKSRVVRDLGIAGGIEDILITLQSQHHIIRPMGAAMFLYVTLDRGQGNLAMARHKMARAVETIEFDDWTRIAGARKGLQLTPPPVQGAPAKRAGRGGSEPRPLAGGCSHLRPAS